MRHDPSTKELNQPRYGENGVATLQCTRQPGSMGFTLHWHDRIELLRVREGQLVLYRNEQGPYVVEAGEMAIICPRQTHRGTAGGTGLRYDVVMFEPETFMNAVSPVRSSLRALADTRLTLDPVCGETAVVDAFDRLMQPTDAFASVGDVYRLLSLLFKHCHPVEVERMAADERFLAVVRYVDEHFLDPLSTAELSARFGYDESYFCRRFKRATGIRLMTYIEILRLETAQEMLLQSHEAISTIALQCGFGDVCYFSARFHKHFGLSPSAFRKQNDR